MEILRVKWANLAGKSYSFVISLTLLASKQRARNVPLASDDFRGGGRLGYEPKEGYDTLRGRGNKF